MTRWLTALSFLIFVFLTRAALAGSPLTLTLPDDGNYSYWIQSRTGAVSALPVNVSHQGSVVVRVPVAQGDHVILLDAATGQWAQQTVVVGADEMPAPIVFALGDFHPLSLSAPASAAPGLAPSDADADSGRNPLPAALFTLALILAAGWLAWLYLRRRNAGRRLAEKEASKRGPSEGELDPGVILMPGHRGPDAGAETNFQRGPEMPMAEPAALIGVQGLAAGSTFALTAGNVTIGRDGENEIVLAENTVSRYHARLLRQDNGQFALTDLGSANGVYVNGTRVQRAILHSGDQIKVGDNYFRFQTNAEAR